jgi:hypothetical protein
MIILRFLFMGFLDFLQTSSDYSYFCSIKNSYELLKIIFILESSQTLHENLKIFYILGFSKISSEFLKFILISDVSYIKCFIDFLQTS